MTHFESLTSPSHLYTRAEVLSKPSPVPSASGVYAWFFKEIPGIVPMDGCVTKDGTELGKAPWKSLFYALASRSQPGDLAAPGRVVQLNFLSPILTRTGIKLAE